MFENFIFEKKNSVLSIITKKFIIRKALINPLESKEPLYQHSLIQIINSSKAFLKCKRNNEKEKCGEKRCNSTRKKKQQKFF